MGSRNPMTFKKRDIPFLKLCSFKWLLSSYIFFKIKRKHFCWRKEDFFFLSIIFGFFLKEGKDTFLEKIKFAKNLKDHFQEKEKVLKKGI